MIDATGQDRSERSPNLLGERFELLESAGTGGMGWVYKARDRRSDQLVAIKVLFPHLIQNPDNLARFRNEVLIARRLSHPHIVRTYTFDEIDGHYALTMEFVDGVSLADQIATRSKPLTEPESVRILLELAAALAYAHAHGVVHCDLKPANILITNDGTIKVADFGISQLLHVALRRTGGSMVVGTPIYMAPEQFAGGRVDFRTDLYSFGALAYELLTGAPPFTGESYFVLAEQHRRASIPSLRIAGGEISNELAKIVESLLEKNPNDRPASAALVIERLQSLSSAAALPAPMKVTLPTASYVSVEQPETRLTGSLWSRMTRREKKAALFACAFLAVLIFLFAARTNHSTRMRIAAVAFRVEKSLDVRLPLIRDFLGYEAIDGHSSAELFAYLETKTPGRKRYHEILFAIVWGGLDLQVHNESGNTAMHLAITHEYWFADRLLKLFTAAGLSVDIKNRIDGDTPLHQVTRAEQMSIMNLLMTFGPNLNVQNHSGDTPLHIAARHRFFHGVSALRRNGANVNIQNLKGETALHLLVNGGSLVGVRELLQSDPNVELVDAQGQTARARAQELAEREPEGQSTYSAISAAIERYASRNSTGSR